MTFDLPIPPSTNNLFATYKNRRIPSRAYKAWRKEAGDALGAQYARYGAPSIGRPVSLRIRINLNYRGDISNRVKAIEDLLVDTLDMPNDRYIEHISIERDPDVPAAVVTIGSEDDFQSFGDIAADIVSRLRPGIMGNAE